jgi:SLT domain-containing protein
MQFLDGTWKTYGNGLNRNNPTDQVVAGINYIKQRYGTPQNAVAFWQKNHWY